MIQATITIDLYEDKVDIWTQVKDKLPPEQEKKFHDMLEEVKATIQFSSTEKPNQCPDSLTLSDTMKIGT